jgi:hypothetical protein
LPVKVLRVQLKTLYPGSAYGNFMKWINRSTQYNASNNLAG